ncbi:hypothetical protein K0B04_04540 [Patescibacteria group bacterium]|nr:hypothetical protein [Patescibacteria group bacterium]
MDNIPVPENTTSQEKVSKKLPLIKVIIPLLLLVVLGVLGFVFRDRIFYSPTSYDNEEEVAKPSDSGESSFGNMLGNNLSESDRQLLQEYTPGENEIRGIFTSYDNGNVVTERGPFTLSDNFILFCRSDVMIINGQEVDASDVFVDYSNTPNNLKVDMIKEANRNITPEKRIFLLENYPIGAPIKLGFLSTSESTSAEVNIVTLYFGDINVCYE